MYIYISFYMFIYVFHVCMHACVCEGTCVGLCAGGYVHVDVWVCVHVCECACACGCTYVWVYVHVSMWVCIALVCACAEVDTGNNPQSSSWSFMAWSHKWNSELIDTTGLFSHPVLETSYFYLLGGNPNICPHACREALTTKPSPQPYISF